MGLSRAQIAQRGIRGIIYQGLGQYSSMAIGIVKGMILARLVAPEYFGQVMLALTYASFINFAKMFLREGVTRDTSNDQSRLFTLYSIELLSTLPGFILLGVLTLLAPWLRSLFGDAVPSIVVIRTIWVILGVRFISTLASVPLYLLERDMRFGEVSRLTVYGTFFSLIIAVPVAIAGYPVLAVLLDLAVIPPIVTAVGAVLFARWRPRPAWDQDVARENFKFGMTLWSNGIFSKISYEFDDWLVGTFSGNSALGFYGKAYTPLAKLPLDVAAGMISSVALGVYGQSKSSGKEVVVRAYFLMTWLLTRVIAISSIVLLAATEEITLILYGPQWLAVVPLVRLMALYVLTRPFWQNDAQLLISLGHEKQVRRYQGTQAVILLLLGPPLVLGWNAAGASIAVSVMGVVGAVLIGWYTARQLKVDYMSLYMLPALLVLILSPGIWWLGLFFAFGPLLGFIVKGSVIAILFCGIIWFVEQAQVKSAIALFMDNISGLPQTEVAEE